MQNMRSLLVIKKYLQMGLVGMLASITISARAQEFTAALAKRENKVAWRKTMPAILQQIIPPIFAATKFTIDDTLNSKQQIQLAIDSLSKLGGGQVFLPAGTYFCDGPIHLKSNVNLHLSKNAQLVFSTNPAHYLPVVKVRWEGTICYNYSPLVYAVGQKNIAITGEGTINGQADKFWYSWKKQPDGNDQEKDKVTLRNMGRDGVLLEKRVFGASGKLRPSLIEFMECENVLIQGVTLQQSPFWTVHPVFCTNITIRNITIEKGTTNDDGIDPDGCQFVLIENCKIDTDDDPIALKAGRDNDAWDKMPTKNVVVRNIVASSRVGNGFCIGSEMSAGVENIFVENLRITNADNGINMKSNLDRGGYIKNVFIRNVVIDSVSKIGILMQKDYHSYRGGNHPSVYSGIFFSGVEIKYVQRKGIRIAGVAQQSIKNVWLHKVNITKQLQPNEMVFTQNIVIKN